jgi:hypothetical protein
VTRESAALIAQVIPVVAIALGLEIRSAAKGLQSVTLTENEDYWRLYPIFAQLAMLVVLSIAECAVMQVVISDGPEPGWFWVLRTAIVIAFLAPMADAVYRVSRALPEGRAGAVARRVIQLIDSVVSLAVILTAIFWPWG